MLPSECSFREGRQPLGMRYVLDVHGLALSVWPEELDLGPRSSCAAARCRREAGLPAKTQAGAGMGSGAMERGAALRLAEVALAMMPSMSPQGTSGSPQLPVQRPYGMRQTPACGSSGGLHCGRSRRNPWTAVQPSQLPTLRRILPWKPRLVGGQRRSMAQRSAEFETA